MSGGGARRGLRTGLLAFLGIVLIQVAWIFAVPPFQGPDEHDHAFKAGAVAHGDFAAQHPPSPGGWGELMRVPRDLVDAAEPVCRALPYTQPENCSATGSSDGSLVTVATSAARYNPVFYVIVGTVARGSDGVVSLYVMRFASALMCAALLAAAVSVTGVWSRTLWPYVAILAAMTPTLVFSTAIVAPNGLELASAALAWSAGLGLVSAQVDVPVQRGVLIAMTAASCVLVTLRSLGPLWLVLIVLTLTVVGGPARMKLLLRRRAVARSAALVAAVTVLAVGWSVIARTNAPVTGSSGPMLEPGQALGQWVLWFLQSAGAFPLRNDPAPLILYAVVFSVWAALLWTSWRAADTRTRIVMTGIVVVASVIPLAVTVATYAQNGFIWQGRYSYPLAMGVLFLCGWALDRQKPLAVERGALAVVGVGFAAAQLIGVLHVYRKELQVSPLRQAEAWLRATDAELTLLVVTGAALVLTAMVLAAATPMAAGPVEARRLVVRSSPHAL